MGNEGRRLTCRQTSCVDNTLCQSFHWQVRTCQRIGKCPALRLSIPDCSNTAHNVNKTIIVINFSFQMTCSTLFTTLMIHNSSTHSPPSCTAADTPSTTQSFLAKLTVYAVSPMANSPSAEFDTPSVSEAPTLPSELAITDLARRG